MSFLPALFVGVVIVPTTAWMALAMHYRARWPWLRWCLSASPVITIGASLVLLPWLPEALAVWLSWFVGVLAWWLSLRPQADRDWAVGMQVVPRAELIGETLRIQNVRNFSYPSAGEVIQRFEERTYNLQQLRSLDYFLSHWSGPIMAHTLVSFGFEDGQYLCVSVEARRQRWQSYSPLWGLFRAYELMFVFGDERDIVRLRTNIRHERVYMYRLKMPPDRLRRLLVDYVNRAEALAVHPRWYNSVTSNCTTNLFYQGHADVPWLPKAGIFLNGLSARTLYRLGFLDNRLPFKELQSRSEIRKWALAAGEASDFSQLIRAHADGSAT